MRVGRLLFGVIAAPILIGASEPLRLQPSTPWDVDYAENSCRLMREFGEGKTKVLLQFQSEAPGEMHMLAVGNPLATSLEKVGARFLPVGGKLFEGEPAQSVTKDLPALLWPWVHLLPDSVIEQNERDGKLQKREADGRPPPIDLLKRAREQTERERFAEAATELQIVPRHDRPVILETASMGKALAALDQCTRDSLKDWGIDPALEDQIVRPAWARHPNYWFSPADYPPEMARRGEEAEVRVRLLVDATGRVTKCTSISNFKQVEFSQIACAGIVKRARLEPAELADGTHVPSYYTKRIVFRMAR